MSRAIGRCMLGGDWCRSNLMPLLISGCFRAMVTVTRMFHVAVVIIILMRLQVCMNRLSSPRPLDLTCSRLLSRPPVRFLFCASRRDFWKRQGSNLWVAFSKKKHERERERGLNLPRCLDHPPYSHSQRRRLARHYDQFPARRRQQPHLRVASGPQPHAVG